MMLMVLSCNALDLCLIDYAQNPRVASVFSQGLLEKSGSRHVYNVVNPNLKRKKGELLCDNNVTAIHLVKLRHVLRRCMGETDICILVHDERCKAPSAKPGELARWTQRILSILAGIDNFLIAEGETDILTDVMIIATDYSALNTWRSKAFR